MIREDEILNESSPIPPSGGGGADVGKLNESSPIPPSGGGGALAYIKEVYSAIKSLLVGMKRTGYYFTHHKEIITQEYPDNRHTMVLPDRFKGEVVMPHDEKNEHRCTGCTACELACPNGTIKVITKFDITAEGKKKKAIDKLVYHLELCTMCNLCIIACPSDAIVMAQTFEHSVFDRSKLTKVLNNPDSKIMEGIE